MDTQRDFERYRCFQQQPEPAFSSDCFLGPHHWFLFRWFPVFPVELVLEKLLRIVSPFQVKEFVSLRIGATKLIRSRMQPVWQVVSASGR
jgi:hypothetical protein